MTWVAVGMTALGVVQGDKKEQKAIQDMQYKAELMKYSPYNKVAAQIAGSDTADMTGKSLEMGLGGAMNGMSASDTMKKQGYFDAKPQTPGDAMAKLQPGMGPDGKPMSAEEQQKWNLLAIHQNGTVNA